MVYKRNKYREVITVLQVWYKTFREASKMTTLWKRQRYYTLHRIFETDRALNGKVEMRHGPFDILTRAKTIIIL